MAETEHPSCKERIQEHMKARLDDLATALDEEPGDEDYDRDDNEVERLRESVLSIATAIRVDICLSWGGPEDGFVLFIDDEGDAIEGYYYFKDWFDGAREYMNSSEIDMVEQVYGPFDYLVE